MPRRNRIFIYSLLLLAINAVICRGLFTVEFTRYFQSNEGTLVALSRFLLEHGPGARWFAWWNGGMPYEYTYLPFLQYLVAGFAWVTHASPALAFHIVAGCFYCLGPVTLFLFLWAVSQQAERSFLAGLLYSLWSPAAVLVPEIGADLGNLWGARRLYNVVNWGEAPHIAALTLLPPALLLLYWALTRRRYRYWVGAGALMAAVVLTNAFGAVSLAIMTAGLLAVVRGPSWRSRLALTAIAGGLAYCWISPWLPPWVIRTMLAYGPTTAGDYRFGPRNYLAWMVVLGFTALLWRLTRHSPNPVTRFAALVTAIYAAIVLLHYRAGIELAPQPFRFHSELELAVCVLLIFAGADLLPRWKGVAGVLVTLFCLWQVPVYSEFARRLIRPAAPESSLQYKVARWMNQHLPGRRAFVAGDVGFWYNVFSDNPQMGTGSEGTNPNWVQQVAVGALYGTGGRISAFWLKAFGCHAVTVPGAASRETWKPIRDVHKFDGLLPVLWHEEDDTIFGVPQRSPSLAHVLPPAAAVSRRPINALDIGPAKKYVAALDDATLPLAEADWIGTDRMRIRTEMQPDQLLSVQVTYDPGWHARVHGTERPVTQDGLGLLLVRPSCSGPCEVELAYAARPEAALLRFLSAAVMALVIAAGWVRPATRQKAGTRCLIALIALAHRAAGWVRRLRPQADMLALGGLLAASAVMIAPRTDYVLAALSRLFREYAWTWDPVWRCGHPFRDVYPLFHLAVALTPLPIERSLQLWSVLSHLLAPVTVYLFARQLFRSRAPAFLAAAAFLPFVAHAEAVRSLSLALTLAVLTATLRDRWTIASLLAGAVFLLSGSGAIPLLFGLAAVGVARRSLRVLGVAAAGYGLAAFWMPRAPAAAAGYRLELNLLLVLLGVALLWLSRRRRAVRILPLVVLAGFLASSWRFQPPAAKMRDPLPARIADWLNRNAARSRVLAAGELESALNLWSDVRQWRGGPPGAADTLVLEALRQSIASCGGGELARLWMRAVNAPLAIVHGPQSHERFHLTSPENFSALPVVWSNGAGDSIHRLPGPELHEAVVVSLGNLPRVRSADDLDGLRAYVRWAEGVRPARLAWSRNDTGEIDADVGGREAVLVKTNYDRGWRAAGATTRPDPIGFLLLELPPGQHHVTLHFGAVWEQWLGRAVALATIALLLAGRFTNAWPLGVIALVAALAAPSPHAPRFERPPQPTYINAGGILNGGGLPLPLIRGFPIEIYGTGFGGPHDGVRVLAGGREAPILYRSENQVNVRLPEDAPDAVEIRVEVNGCPGNAFVLPVQD